MQKLTYEYNGLIRVIAKRDGSIRYNPSAGGKSVLNFVGVSYFGTGNDEDDPVFFKIAAWEKMADRLNGRLEHGQIIYLKARGTVVNDPEYGMSADISVNNGYQLVLFAENIKLTDQPKEEDDYETEEVPTPKSVAAKKQNIPF